MPWSSKRAQSAAVLAESEPIVFDDGGSGLLEACQHRFGPRGCEIACDARHTVWVTRADGGLSVGLSAWMLSRRSMDELLESVAERFAG